MIKITDFRALDRTFIVAEIGVNHEGDRAVAADLIRKAAACGADAVKFQTYEASRYVSIVQPDRLARVRRFQLSHDDFRMLAGVARECGILFFSTPLDPSSADFLDGIAPIFKISSGDLTYTSLIRHVAAKRKPMIISTGLGTRQEIAAAVEAARAGAPDIVERGHLMLLHCVAAYPTPAEEANLRNLSWLQREFGLPIGYSDHTLGTKACELAIATGAMAIEKHFTYRKENQAFHDHAISADPADLSALIKAIRTAETYLGVPVRSRTPSEEKGLAHMRRGLAAAVDLRKGASVGEDALTALRPAWGLEVGEMERVIGRRLVRDIAAGDLIKEEDLAP